MNRNKTTAILLALVLALSATGCGAAASKNGAVIGDAVPDEAVSVEKDENSPAIDELFSKRDLSGKVEDYVTVTLSGTEASCDGEGAETGKGTVRITAEGSYLLTGFFQGSIVIDAGDEDKVQIILSGADICSDGTAAVCVLNADKVFLTLADGTENSIETSGGLAVVGEVKADGAVFSRCDLTVNGTGSLDVRCDSGHGIVSKDDLKIVSCVLSVEAAKQGLSGKDSVSVASGTITIDSGTDGIQSENTDDTEKGSVNLLGGNIAINSGSDGVDATGSVTVSGGTVSLSCADDGVHADATLTVSAGSITVSRCYEGLEAKDIVITGGTIDLTASDDGLNAAGGNDGSGWGGRFGNGDPFAAQDVSITISGGELRINSNGDGIDSNGDLTISGGTILVSGPTNGGNGAIDYNGTGVITGGILVATGASGMAENFGSGSTQPSMLVNFSSTVRGGTEIRVNDASDSEIISFTPEKDYQCAVISTPDFEVGESYSVSAGSQSQNVTFSSVIYGSGSGMGGPGGMPGGFGGGFGGEPGNWQGGWGGSNGGSGEQPGSWPGSWGGSNGESGEQPGGWPGGWGGSYGSSGEQPGGWPGGERPERGDFGGFGGWPGNWDGTDEDADTDSSETHSDGRV